MRLWPGSPFPLGATYDGTGTNFAVFSEVADAVELCLFEPDGTETRVALPERTAMVWHGYAPKLGPGQRYGFRVHGPYEPSAGLRCHPSKLLLDPYATAVEGEVDWDEAMFTLPLRRPGRAGERPRLGPAHAQGRGDEPVLRLGARPARRARPGTRPSSTRSTSRASRSATRASPRSCAAPTPGSRTRPRSSTSRRSASRRSSCCRCTSSSRTPTSSSAGCATTGATTRSASSRRTTATAPPARPAARCRSSSRWSRRCTRPGSR